LGRSEKRAGEFASPPDTLLFPGKGEDFAKPRDAHAVTRTFVRHAKKLGFEMRFHDIRASHLTILLDNGVAIPTVNARNTPIRANIVGPPNVATRIKASMAASHFGASCSAFGSFVM
jgi:integrase